MNRRLVRSLLSGAWSLLKGLQARLPPGSVHPGTADDRFQAALATRLHAAELVPGRRVLDRAPVIGTVAVLDRPRPKALHLVEGDPRRRRALASEGVATAELLQAAPEASDEGRYDLVLNAGVGTASQGQALVSEASKLLRKGGSLLLWEKQPQVLLAPVRGAQLEVLSAVEERLRQEMVTWERLCHLAPPGYRPSWSDRLPARARAHEYRIFPLRTEEVGDELLCWGWLASGPRRHLPRGSQRLHVGCGDLRLDGWINLDRVPFAAADVVLDVTEGLPFEQLEAVYAEHFLEHLPVDRAIDFLQSSHTALAEGGWLRLSTPSLDWTWHTHYRPGSGGDEPEDLEAGLGRAIELNRAFYGWKHQFLWNRETLTLALRAAGFVDLRWPARGESSQPFLRGLERHPAASDLPDCPHVLVAEARKGAAQPDLLDSLLARVRGDFLTVVEYLG